MAKKNKSKKEEKPLQKPKDKSNEQKDQEDASLGLFPSDVDFKRNLGCG